MSKNEFAILAEKTQETEVVTIDESDFSLSEDDTKKQVTGKVKTRKQMATSTPASKSPVSARTRHNQIKRGKNLLEKTFIFREI